MQPHVHFPNSTATTARLSYRSSIILHGPPSFRVIQIECVTQLSHCRSKQQHKSNATALVCASNRHVWNNGLTKSQLSHGCHITISPKTMARTHKNIHSNCPLKCVWHATNNSYENTNKECQLNIKDGGNVCDTIGPFLTLSKWWQLVFLLRHEYDILHTFLMKGKSMLRVLFICLMDEIAPFR